VQAKIIAAVSEDWKKKIKKTDWLEGFVIDF
jgi:hypothetical protein